MIWVRHENRATSAAETEKAKAWESTRESERGKLTSGGLVGAERNQMTSMVCESLSEVSTVFKFTILVIVFLTPPASRAP